MEKILLKNIDNDRSHTLEAYMAAGGYRALETAVKRHAPDEIVGMVKDSELRGRGGAGFPTGLKWSFMPKEGDGPSYLICNADESEPGTFKDRLIIERDPHLLIEGTLIAAYAIRAATAFIYIRGEFVRGHKILAAALEEARAKNFIGRRLFGTEAGIDIILHRGAGSYICGEETALMDSLEGKRGYPRLKPPFPAQQGLYGCPTTVNNVETLANVPFIVERGAEWYRSIGRPKNTGPKLYCLSGHVRRPGVYELPMGVPLRELIFDHGGGLSESGRNLRAVIPGGSSVPVLTAEEIDVCMDFDSLAKAGTMLGSAGVIVMDHTVCMVKSLLNLARFYAHESCGQCTPCREGTGWLAKILQRVEEGKGTGNDLDLLLSISDRMQGNTICPLADAAAMPTRSFVTKFRDEFERHLGAGSCPVGRPGPARMSLAE